MLTIASLSAKFKTLNTDKVIEESFIETKDSFKRINKEQLKTGKTNTGETVKPRYRSSKYARVKNEMNALPGLGVPDLFVTGKFYSGIEADPGKDVIKIISKDSKGPDLEDKYPGIFGLGSSFKKQYLDEELRPVLQGKISTIVGLSFK